MSHLYTNNVEQRKLGWYIRKTVPGLTIDDSMLLADRIYDDLPANIKLLFSFGGANIKFDSRKNAELIQKLQIFIAEKFAEEYNKPLDQRSAELQPLTFSEIVSSVVEMAITQVPVDDESNTMEHQLANSKNNQVIDESQLVDLLSASAFKAKNGGSESAKTTASPEAISDEQEMEILAWTRATLAAIKAVPEIFKPIVMDESSDS